jgi:UDP-N-acetyl-2-amino-2-deoxyglucuronate dehydrogenase
MDPHDSVGLLDSFFPEARFFTEIERFDRYIEKLRRTDPSKAVDYISICSPNYLHDAHVRLALRVKSNAICEKPLVISPWNLDQLKDLEDEHGKRVYTVLQLRMHPDLQRLARIYQENKRQDKSKIQLTYITRRGNWYHNSWKGQQAKSGGLAMNIGIHFFDLLLWMFGSVEKSEVHLTGNERMAGALVLEQAEVSWFLSVNGKDLPEGCLESGRSAFRSITVDGEELEFSGGFGDLHTRVYEETLAGKGFGLEDARPSIELVHQIRTAEASRGRLHRHPFFSA